MKNRFTIVRYGINGEGIGFYNKKPVFIPGALQGEEVDVDFLVNHGSYYEAKGIRLIKRSPFRCTRSCKNNLCDGCALLHSKYTHQLMIKQSILQESLQKYGPKDCLALSPIIASDKQEGYRNQAKLIIKMIDGKLTYGSYKQNSNYFVPQTKPCIVHHPLINETANKVVSIFNQVHYTDYDLIEKKGLRAMVIRVLDNQVSLTLITGKDKFDKSLIDKIKRETKCNVLAQCINTKRNLVNPFDGQMIYFTKNRNLMVSINGYQFSLSNASFFQLNTDTLKSLVDYIETLMKANSTVYEGYCGVGILGQLLRDKISCLYGSEVIGNAIDNARHNASLNHIRNFYYEVGDSCIQFTKLSKKQRFDYLLIDPPRSGLSHDMIQSILKSKVKSIIYISCNPATLAKNLNELSSRYHIESIQPFDMFPNTQHVETVCLLSQRKPNA